jgi:hypothetical protein
MLAQVSVWGVLLGAAIAVVAQISIHVLLPWWRRKRMWKNLKCYPDLQLHAEVASVRVHNGSDYCLRNCWAYLWLQYDPDNDIVPPGRLIEASDGVHFTPERKKSSSKDYEDRLHWAIGDGPAQVDIAPGERQALRVFRLTTLAANAGSIGVFTEVGHGMKGTKFRVFLRTGKLYHGEISIVSADIPRKAFPITIDTADSNNPQVKIDNP